MKQEKTEAEIMDGRIRWELYRAGKDKPCVRCGGTFPGYVMEYHHIKDRLKAKEPLCYLTQYCRSTTVEEIPDCLVVCANCHRIIHVEARAETGTEAREEAMRERWIAKVGARKESKHKRIVKIKEHYKILKVETREKYMADILPLVPADKAIPKEKLIALVQTTGIGRNKAWACINALVSTGAIHIHKVFRPGISPRVDLSRTPKPSHS